MIKIHISDLVSEGCEKSCVWRYLGYDTDVGRTVQ